MESRKLTQILEILRGCRELQDAPAMRLASSHRYPRTPYTILISVILSFRTRDEVTFEAAHRLFALATTPKEMVNVSRETIEEAIYPVGFYRRKAETILRVSRELLDRFGGEVPASLAELTSLPGVGPKAAKIVLERAFGKDVAAVDTHVHRLLNLWQIVKTKTPERTDRELERLLPLGAARGANRLLVAFGQRICRPTAPKCGECPIRHLVPCAP